MTSPPTCAPGATASRPPSPAAAARPACAATRSPRAPTSRVGYLTRLEQGHASHPSAARVRGAGPRPRAAAQRRRTCCTCSPVTPRRAEQRFSSEITPAVQRLLERFDDLPVLVYDLAWELVAKNRLGEALTGLATGNIARNHFVGESLYIERTPEQDDAMSASIVADLHSALIRHPADRAAARHRRRVARAEPALRGAVEAEPGRGPHLGDEDDQPPGGRPAHPGLRRPPGARLRPPGRGLQRPARHARRGRAQAARAGRAQPLNVSGSGPVRSPRSSASIRSIFLRGELEVEDVDVLLDPRGRHRLREHDVAELDVPAQDDLAGRAAVRLGDLRDRPGPSSAAPWASGLQASVTMPRSACSRRRPCCVQVRVQLDLVDGGRDAGLVDDPAQVRRPGSSRRRSRASGPACWASISACQACT